MIRHNDGHNDGYNDGHNDRKIFNLKNSLRIYGRT